MIPGTQQELQFWERFVKTDRFLTGWVAKGKTPELNAFVAHFIQEHNHARILDCGSGVVSILNGLCDDAELVATDLLGDEYMNIFDYNSHQIVPPLPHSAESLPYIDAFDIVHMSNALDHTQRPTDAYMKMVDACKPGGFVIIQGFENEADHERWYGMHQWNIRLIESEKGNILDIKGKTEHFQFADTPYVSYNTTFENGKTWYIWVIRK
ncbi:MAG TPA: methyltransferase domain-containing protein [Ferruginibacter sp.]|nr:methyltransferase domain-containing protein [Ferruginibacter sp.]